MAVAVPTFVFVPPYETLSDVLRPPGPVVVAVHGVCAEPVYTTDDGVQVTTVDVGAGVIWKVVDALLI